MFDEGAGRKYETNRRWYVAVSQPRKEFFAKRNLDCQGFESFLPQIDGSVRRARKMEAVRRPLFPRYLFVSLDLGVDRWRSVMGTFGISHLVMQGERPLAAAPGIVEALLAAQDCGFDFRHHLAVGQQVRFIFGPFADQIGRLAEMKDRERVQVLIEMLGAARRVRVDISSLAPADL